jgi:hypothetical protein
MVFVVAEVVGGLVYFVNGRRVWFFGVFGDEWDFLAGRSFKPPDLLRSHGDHLVALPALIFRVTFLVFGLRTYLPYQALAIALHLTAAALLRSIMRRAGVNEWIATAAAGLFVFFGAGSQDILIAFQITFSGALVLGLTQLLLADHEGPFDRRDAGALLAGFGALLCSNVSLVMIAVVGIMLVLRRRWFVALTQTVPLGVTFIAWSFAYGRSTQTFSSAGSVVRTVRNMIASTFNALGQVPFVGWVLTLMVLVGLLLGVREAIRERNASRIATPIALAIGSLLFATLIAAVRFDLNNTFAASRYLHILAAMLLPACAVAADRIARQWKALAPVVIAAFLVGIPGNVISVDKHVFPSQFYASQRRIITSLPRMAVARSVPRDLHPIPAIAAEVTVGWLLDGAKSGRIPRPGPLSSLSIANNTLRLSLEQFDAKPPRSRCRPLTSPLLRRLSNGESVSIAGTVTVQLLDPTGVPLSGQLLFGSSLLSTIPYHTLRAVRAPLNLRLRPAAAFPALC